MVVMAEIARFERAPPVIFHAHRHTRQHNAKARDGARSGHIRIDSSLDKEIFVASLAALRGSLSTWIAHAALPSNAGLPCRTAFRSWTHSVDGWWHRRRTALDGRTRSMPSATRCSGPGPGITGRI